MSRLLVSATAVCLLLAGCADADDDVSGGAAAATSTTDTSAPAPAPSPATDPPPSPPALPSLLAALCDATTAADDDEAVARQTFQADAHGPLHTLARDLQGADARAVAARLLEAKQRVEDAFSSDPVPADLAERLATLTDATRNGQAALGRPAPECP